MKEQGRDGVEVMDVAELVARSLPKVHANHVSVPVPPQRTDGPIGPSAEE